MSHWWVILFYNPATTWKVTPTTPETSFFTFFFPASHFFTDRVKLCSTNCLNIIFSAVGWVRAEGGGVTPESTAEKKNLKCIWHSDKLHLPHHPVGSKESPMCTGAQIVVQKKNVSIQSHFLLAWVFSRLGDHYEPTWNNILQKEWHRRKPEALHSAHLKFKPLWYGFPSWANIQLLFFFSLSTPKLCQRTRRSLLCGSDSLWRSVGGLQTNRKWRNMPKKMARLFPKCHVSLNKSQRWFSLRWLLIAAKEKHSPAVNLHFNMPPTSSMLLLLRIY